MSWPFQKRAKKPSYACAVLDGRLITYAVRRDPSGEIVIGKDGRICAATEQLELRFSDGSIPFSCPMGTATCGELMSHNGVLITGDDITTGKRVTVVAYYKYYR